MTAPSKTLAIAAAAVVLIGSPVWLPRFCLPLFGDFLVQADEAQKSDVALVLAGDSSGNRILRGADLVQQGFASKALVSGPAGLYGTFESDLAVSFAVRHGYPESLFDRLPNHARSTREEALAIVPELQRRNVTKLLVVTSETHTRRARNVYRDLARGIQLTVVAAPEPDFRPHEWWKEREGRKTVLIEWLKTFANWLGL